MTIFANTLKRVLKRKLNLLFMVVVPVMMIAFALYMSGDRGVLRVGVADHDKTMLTGLLADQLKEKCSVVEIAESEIQGQIINAKLDYAICIEKGFTKGIICGEAPQVKGYALKETDKSIPIKIRMDSYLNAAMNIAKASGGDEEKFYSGLNQYNTGSFSVEEKSVDTTRDGKSASFISIGFLIMNMLFLSTFASSQMIIDKEKKIFYRVFTAPITLKNYMLQSILSYYTVMLLQVAAIFAIMVFGFKADMGASLINVFLVLALFSALCVSFGVAINHLGKDARQAGLISSLTITPMCMLGGCFWPRELMPEIMQKAGNFVPTTWVIKAVERVLFGEPITAVYLELSILLMFSVVFFLLSSWRKAEVTH